jgi:hypothetical protein
MEHFLYSICLSIISLIIYIFFTNKKKDFYDKQNINTYIGIVSLVFVFSYYFIFNNNNKQIHPTVTKMNDPVVPF